MIHRYKINTQKDEQVTVPKDTIPISINGCKVSWDINDNEKLEKIIIDISGFPIKLDERGIILSSYPEIDTIAFNLAAFLSNSIFIQTSIDAFDPFSILTASPELIPESDEENKTINETKIGAYSSFDAKIKILGKFDPEVYVSKFNTSVAVAQFAAAWRSNNPFQKFECFFKVVESILKKGKHEKAHDFDIRLSKYAIKFDKQFTKDVIENLRRSRNRCAHPDNPAHLSPDDINAYYMIRRELKTIERLAKLLLNNPLSEP